MSPTGAHFTLLQIQVYIKSMYTLKSWADFFLAAFLPCSFIYYVYEMIVQSTGWHYMRSYDIYWVIHFWMCSFTFPSCHTVVSSGNKNGFWTVEIWLNLNYCTCHNFVRKVANSANLQTFCTWIFLFSATFL